MFGCNVYQHVNMWNVAYIQYSCIHLVNSKPTIYPIFVGLSKVSFISICSLFQFYKTKASKKS
jgi:hypothetical protein